MEKFKVGIIGGTGMVGQRFISLVENHPWFELKVIAASARSAGKTYEEAARSRWAIETPFPEKYKDLVVMDADADKAAIAAQVDFVFCAVDMPKDAKTATTAGGRMFRLSSGRSTRSPSPLSRSRKSASARPVASSRSRATAPSRAMSRR